MPLRSFDTVPPANLVDGCVEVYRAAFGRAPYGETAGQAEALRDRLDRYSARAGFLVPVCLGDDDRVEGFALAVTAHPGDWWRDQVATAVGAEATDRWLGDSCCEVVHVAVRPDVHRRGHGQRLLGAIGSTAGTRTAVLSCHPEAVAAQQLYLGEGWQVLTTNFRTQPEQLGYWLMVRHLESGE
ncbi:MAG: GNAT family N-acetyltransferase [Nocardioidaceae bacterium]